MIALALSLALAQPAAADRAKLSRDEQESLLRRAGNGEIVAGGRASVAALGDYRVLLAKRERIEGRLQELQLRRLTVRERPFAVYIVAADGGEAGRRIRFDATRDPRHLQVREPGMLGWRGWIRIAVDDPLVFKSTNHPPTDVGFGAMLRLIEKDLEQAKPFGGYRRTDEGWNGRGHYCIRYDAPPGAADLYARRSVVCLDPASWLPLELTVCDGQGLLETFRLDELVPNAPGAEAELRCRGSERFSAPSFSVAWRRARKWRGRAISKRSAPKRPRTIPTPAGSVCIRASTLAKIARSP